MTPTGKMLALLPLLALSMYSCKKDNNSTGNSANQVNYALSVTGGTGNSQTTYIFGTNNFPTGTVGTSNAAELSSSGLMFTDGTDVYISAFGAPAILWKYTFDANGQPVQAGNFSVPALKTFGAVLFISSTEAYAASNGFGGVPKLVKFNPSNMQISGYIDLSGLQKTGATDVFYLGLVSRDNYLYMGVNYQNASFANLADSVFVAVINKTTATVEKVIADGRSSEMWVGGSANGFTPNALIKDVNNDIYVTGYANNGKPSGLLRIKNGTTDFDSSYFFNLNAATGGPCLGLFYFGSNLVFTIHYADVVAYPFDTDANFNPYAAAEYYKIDLAAETSAGSISTSLPKIFGNNTFMTQWDNDKIYLNVPAADSNSIYSYKIADGTVAKEFGLTGQCNGFTKIN